MIAWFAVFYSYSFFTSHHLENLFSNLQSKSLLNRNEMIGILRVKTNLVYKNRRVHSLAVYLEGVK